MFRTSPTIQRIALGDTAVCVVDDALQDPLRWVDLARRHSDGFIEAPGNAYPGLELPMPDSIAAQCMAYFDAHFAPAYALRGCVQGHAKLAIATRPESALQPFQTIPHIDRLSVEPTLAVMASVLYLFDDALLGGTAFYRPRQEAARLAVLFADAARLDPVAFSARHGIARGYPAGSTDWFEHVLTVPPRRNRLVVYPGTVFHSSHVPDPARLQADPGSGRLTLNAFHACRRLAA